MSDPVRVQIELAPAAHVTEEMRTGVVNAVVGAGLPMDGWLQLRGEARPEDWPHHRVAPPRLHLVLSSEAASAMSIVVSRRESLGEALAAIRERFPALPLGIRSETAARKRWLGFKPSASPHDIRLGMADVVDVDESSADVLGWDQEQGQWLPL